MTVDLLDLKTKAKMEFEETIISNGYIPLISISTNHQPGCKKTCIDNILTNQCAGNILASGKIAGKISTHIGIFQVSKLRIKKDSPNISTKIKIEYDYNHNNLTNFVNMLSKELELSKDANESFEAFKNIFQSCIEKTCKLDIPKTTKRNHLNNPWITPGITKSILTNDQLYANWMGSFKTKDGGDDKLKENSQ